MTAVAERTSNAYSPEMQRLQINLHEVMERDLKPLGKVIDLNGFMASTPEHGVFMDSVEIIVEHSKLRVPIRLKAFWNKQKNAIVYHHNYSNDSTYRKEYNLLVQREYVPYRGFSPGDAVGREATETVMSRLDAHPVWEMYRKSQQKHFFAPQHRAWMKAADAWNTNRRKTFSDVFESEQERGVFMNHLLNMCQQHDVRHVSGIAVVGAFFFTKRKGHIKGISPMRQVPDFALNHASGTVARGGMIHFRATVDSADSSMEQDIYYDGTTLFSSWRKSTDDLDAIILLPL